MALGDILSKLWADQATQAAIILTVVVAVLDFVTGSLRAISNGTFTLDAFDVWVRVTVAGRVIPILLVLVTGAVIGNIKLGDFSFNVITTAAFLAAAAFVASGAKSIIDNLNASTPDRTPVE